jgi:hypothetical protein
VGRVIGRKMGLLWGGRKWRFGGCLLDLRADRPLVQSSDRCRRASNLESRRASANLELAWLTRTDGPRTWFGRMNFQFKSQTRPNHLDERAAHYWSVGAETVFQDFG